MKDEEVKFEKIRDLLSIGLGESVPGRIKVWFRKKRMVLCVSERDENEDGVGTGANTTLLSGT
jgi:hypothetical protein